MVRCRPYRWDCWKSDTTELLNVNGLSWLSAFSQLYWTVITLYVLFYVRILKVQLVPNAFSSELMVKVALARAEAHRASSAAISPKHLLLVFAMGSGHLAMILREHDVTPDAVRSKLPAAIDTSQRLISAVQFSEEVIALLRAAFELGHLDPLNQITSEHVLRALLRI
jgi:hypothetical protein